MKFVTRHRAIAAATLSGVILLFTASGGAQEGRQTLKDEGAVLDRYPDGTSRSRPDLVKHDAKTTKLTS